MYLFFDTAANGSPKSWKGAHNDPFNWPRMAHLGWLLYDEKRKLIEKSSDIIKPEGWQMKEEFLSKHHLTQEELDAGIPVKEALTKFRDVVDKATYIVAHNMNLNEGVIGGEMTRKSMAHRLHHSDKYCLMQEATWFTKIPGRGGKYKWPSLQDIYVKMYNKKYDRAGNAYTDAAVTAITFFGLVDMEAIEVF